MMQQSLIVLDHFYDDPNAIREIALGLEYRPKPGATYPGGEAIAVGYDWSEVWQTLRSYIDEPVDAPCPKDPPFPQGKFRLALAKDTKTRVDKVHVDQQRWSAIIYLSRPEDCRGGLALYRHRPTGSVFWDESWFRDHYGHLYTLPPQQFKEEVLKFFRDPRQFEQIGLVPMAYNRAVILMAHVFHGTGVVFGKDKKSGRLTQHFEFYA